VISLALIVFIHEIRIRSAKMPDGLGAGQRSREVVDPGIGAGADSFARFAPTIVLDPSKRNSPAESKMAHCKQQWIRNA
jgi:hypothetical protein